MNSTKLNFNSSRSHSIFKISLVDEKTSISIVDLAGVERAGKAETKGKELQETCKINVSLMVLRKCIDAMENNTKL